MPKPVLLTVDDDADVLSAIARDLRKWYGRDYRILLTPGPPPSPFFVNGGRRACQFGPK